LKVTGWMIGLTRLERRSKRTKFQGFEDIPQRFLPD
jgi:hypothetical protein